MKNGKLRELLQQKIIKTGAVVMASALVLTSSYWSEIFRNDTVFVSGAELPSFVDPADGYIPPNQTPLNSEPPKITTTKKKNKTTKKIKLKEKSKKTYTKKSKTKKVTNTSKKVTGSEVTTVKTETSTDVTSKFTKGSNINKQITTVTTVTTTIVEAMAPANEDVVVVAQTLSNTGSAAAQAQSPESGQVALNSAAPRLDSRVASAYTKLGFTISINPGVNYSGVFDAKARGITLKKSGDTVYHELGHFLAFIAGNVDKAAPFQQVFAQEKDKYTEYNKAYVLQNSSEYFAESFKNYTLNPDALRASRPLTYAAIESALNNVTDSQIIRIQTVYRAVWSA